MDIDGNRDVNCQDCTDTNAIMNPARQSNSLSNSSFIPDPFCAVKKKEACTEFQH